MNNTHSAEDLVIGVDAGGSNIRAVLANRAAEVLGRGAGAGGNALSVPLPQLVERLRIAIRAAVPPEFAGSVRAVLAGFAGVSWLDVGDHGRDAALSALTTALSGIGVPTGIPVVVRNDVEVAFAAAPDYTGDGLVLVGGTGAVAARLVDGHVVATVDGHGGLLDDAGGGLWIGRQAARSALRALDGRAEWTALVPA